MTNNNIEIIFYDIEDVIKFLKKIDEYYIFKVQLLIKLRNKNGTFTTAFPAYLYTSFNLISYYILEDYKQFLYEYDPEDSSIIQFILNIYIISDDEKIIEQKKKYLIDLKNSDVKLSYKFKLKLKKSLQWMIKNLKT